MLDSYMQHWDLAKVCQRSAKERGPGSNCCSDYWRLDSVRRKRVREACLQLSREKDGSTSLAIIAAQASSSSKDNLQSTPKLITDENEQRQRKRQFGKQHKSDRQMTNGEHHR